MNRQELLEHYEFYLDNLQDNEIPLSFEVWKNEYQDDLIKVLKPSIQHSITDYGVEGIDSCLEYKDSNKTYEANNYDAWDEIINQLGDPNEMIDHIGDANKMVDQVPDVRKMVEEYGDTCNQLYKEWLKLGFEAGYNKAKETYKYTEEDVRKVVDIMCENYTRPISKRIGQTEIIQSLKQPK